MIFNTVGTLMFLGSMALSPPAHERLPTPGLVVTSLLQGYGCFSLAAIDQFFALYVQGPVAYPSDTLKADLEKEHIDCQYGTATIGFVGAVQGKEGLHFDARTGTTYQTLDYFYMSPYEHGPIDIFFFRSVSVTN